MDNWAETIATVAVGLIWIIISIQIVQSMRKREFGVGGWGTAARATSPVRYWTFFAYHLLIWNALGVALIAKCLGR